MECIIDGYDFFNMEAQKYYSPPSTWSNEKKKQNAMSKIFSGEWFGAQKRDGIFMMFCKDMEGNMYLRPRSRNTKKEFINKIDWVPHLHPFFDSIDKGTVFLGELYLPKNEQAKTTTSIVNCLLPKSLARQKNEDDKLHYYIFDVLAENGRSYVHTSAEARFDKLNAFARAYPPHYHEWARYYSGEELWDVLQNLLAEGYEGVVITNGNAVYEPGKRSAKCTLKIKKELQDTIDCVITGANPPTQLYTGKEVETWSYWFDQLENEKILSSDYLKQNHVTPFQAYVDGAPLIPVTKNWYYGWAGSLKLGLYEGNKLVYVGNLSGISDEIKENWKDYVGTVVEISCMEISEDKNGSKGFRHPKAINFLRDKEPRECTMDQIK